MNTKRFEFVVEYEIVPATNVIAGVESKIAATVRECLGDLYGRGLIKNPKLDYKVTSE